MYCPKCGDLLEETNGTFRCNRGEMEMSQHLAAHLYAYFISRSEQPRGAPPISEPVRKRSADGGWFCPCCGIAMDEETHWGLGCSRCGLGLYQFLFELVEHHPHTGRAMVDTGS